VTFAQGARKEERKMACEKKGKGKCKGKGGATFAALLLTILAIVAPVAALAQAATPAAIPVPTVDVGQIIIGIVAAITPVVITFATYAARKWLPILFGAVPRIALPFIATALGAALNWLTGVAAGSGIPVWEGALLGLLAVAVREIYNTAMEHGMKP
jgi:hypothetical protein